MKGSYDLFMGWDGVPENFEFQAISGSKTGFGRCYNARI